LKATNTNLQSPHTGLLVLHDIESPGGRHITFEQTFSGMPVFHSQVKVNLDKKKRITSIFDNSWNTMGWDAAFLKNEFETLNDRLIADYFKENRHLPSDFIKNRKVLAVLEEKPVALAEIELWDDKTDEHLLLLADNNLKLFLRRDLNVYWRDNASARVFIPDPLTSAHRFYGSPYVDDSNNDVAVLHSERMPVTISVTFDGSNYKLENPYVAISEFSEPNVAPAESSTPSFDFTRAQAGFEDVNAFYHISVFNEYARSLGFDSLTDFQIFVDAHALNGNDQSMFTPHVFGPRLFFGEGGVDDAEDADVVVHEYGHALSDRAAPSTNNGMERQAVDEGLCDYFATSYSRSIDTFRWADMFTWDGHNEYWNGRTAITPRVYPADLQSSIHVNGEIYNHALTLIWEQIGREKTDRILLQSLYGLASNMSMKDAAMLLYDADSALYGGENFCVIYHALLRKGLTDSVPVAVCKRFNPAVAADAGSDTTICAGNVITLGNPASLNNYYRYNWMPETNLTSPLSLVTSASPTQTTIYTLEAIAFDGSYNTDQVTVNVLQCDIRILNTERFISGEDLIITLPYNSTENSIEVFDIFGKRIFRYTGLAEQSYTFTGSLLPAGVYFFRIKSKGDKKTQKVVKVR
ncbi:MAG TPA: T9SS type A sorting domain-containing protein, partial [Chitinophagales bacterium]|nr:T9SS type A sorting domain-containing protein [Chitinophagales bacterium]